jgi:hypothetical protein
MSWNDYELNRRAMEMKTTASIFVNRMTNADIGGMKEMAEAMERTAKMALDRLKELA